ncbi:MAG: hypothetical protein HYZ57_04690, partial [Acidobacteria bacterium]|nr:hypothetical protein [Acidobacteriota bacterium]
MNSAIKDIRRGKAACAALVSDLSQQYGPDRLVVLIAEDALESLRRLDAQLSCQRSHVNKPARNTLLTNATLARCGFGLAAAAMLANPAGAMFMFGILLSTLWVL